MTATRVSRKMSGAIAAAAISLLLMCWFGSTPMAVAREPSPPVISDFECVFRGLDHVVEAMRQGVEQGRIEDPAQRSLPMLPPKTLLDDGPGGGCLTREHLFPFEDTNGLLLTVFTPAELYDLMVDAANRLLASHGDEFDFIGFWTNFDPALLFGTAFYFPISNDVRGIGNGGIAIGEPETFDRHELFGLAGERLQGMICMWNVNSAYWRPGTNANAAMTRLTLAHEFEHRFGIFLPELADGRRLQGDNVGCGNVYHWNARIDGQGSAINLPEWVGDIGPVRLDGEQFNLDTGGVFGYTDLYLMGYVSASEMDHGNSQLRYMVNSCNSPYMGPVSHFSSADIIEVAGPRTPDFTTAQKHFRTAWIMIHQPGTPPTTEELDKAVGILRQHEVDWVAGTLGRGTMDTSLFTDCNCNGVPDEIDVATGISPDVDVDGIPDECGGETGCVGDIDGDAVVGTLDLLLLLFHWGPCPDCAADLNGDGTVGLGDLLDLFSHWGPCV